jgi:hypothetical protein
MESVGETGAITGNLSEYVHDVGCDLKITAILRADSNKHETGSVKKPAGWSTGRRYC